MKKSTRIIFFILFSSVWNTPAQMHDDTIEYQEIPFEYFDFARTGFIPDTLPQYPSGLFGINSYIARNIRYPHNAASRGKEGRVIVSFSVNIDGSVDEVMVVQSVFKSLDKEAIRVIQNMEDWKPAIKEGKPIKVYAKTIVTFKNFGTLQVWIK